MSTAETLAQIADDLDGLGIAAVSGTRGPSAVCDRLEVLAVQLRVLAGVVVPVAPVWASATAWTPEAIDRLDRTPSVRFAVNHNVPHAAVQVYVGEVDHTHTHVGTLRCTEKDLHALHGATTGAAFVEWERR